MSGTGDPQFFKRASIAFFAIFVLLLLIDYGAHYYGPDRFTFSNSHHKLMDLWWTAINDAKFLVGGSVLSAFVIYMGNGNRKIAFRSVIRDWADESKRYKPPVCGIISFVLPLAGIPFAYMINTPPGTRWGWGGEVPFIMIVFSSILGGLIAAIIGIVRREKFMVLSEIGLLLNGLSIFLALTL